MVRFRAGGSVYAIPVGDVRQVRTGEGISALPSGRTGVAGVVAWEGGALPVVSLLGSGRARLLVLEAGGRRYGLLADEVAGVFEADELRIGPAPAGQVGDLVRGVLEEDGRLVLLLDAAAVAAAVLA